jgi:hypothetical protein
VERGEAESIYEAGRQAVVAVLLRMDEQIARLSERVARQEERIAQLERRLGRRSRNASQPPSADPPTTPPRRSKDPSGRAQGAQPGHEGKGRPLLPISAVDEFVEHWPVDCECGHVFCEAERVAAASRHATRSKSCRSWWCASPSTAANACAARTVACGSRARCPPRSSQARPGRVFRHYGAEV